MNLITLEYIGVYELGPENFSCALLRNPEDGVVLAVWMTRAAAESVRTAEENQQSSPPSVHEVLVAVLSARPGGISSISFVAYHEGVFTATISAGGEEFDLRASDAIVVALRADMPIQANEQVLANSGVFIRESELEEHVGIQVAPPRQRPSSATSSHESRGEDEPEVADGDFESMLRSLGLREEDFQAPPTPDSEDPAEKEDS